MPKLIRKYFWTTLGCFLMAVAVNSFFVRHHFVAGGIAGFSMILYYLFHWPAGIVSFILNIPLFYLAYRYMSRTFCIDSLMGTLIFSVILDATVFLQKLVVVNDPILSCIAGGVVEGLGAALVYRSEASTGGVDIIGFMAKKYKGISVSTTNFAFNVVLMLAAMVFLGIEPVLYTMVMFFISFKATNFFMVGFDYKKTVMIISKEPDKIAERIMREVQRGVTYLHGEGGFTHNETKVLMVVIKLTQLAHIKKIIEQEDPMAFVTVQDANDVFGRGFTEPDLVLEFPEEKKAKSEK